MLLVHGMVDLNFDRLFYAVILPASLYPSERGIFFGEPTPKAVFAQSQRLPLKHEDIIKYFATSALPPFWSSVSSDFFQTHVYCGGCSNCVQNVQCHAASVPLSTKTARLARHEFITTFVRWKRGLVQNSELHDCA